MFSFGFTSHFTPLEVWGLFLLAQRSKCSCSWSSVGMRNLFLLKSLPSNAGVTNVKHGEREKNGCLAAHTELCCACRGAEAGVHFVMWLLFLCSVRAH